MKINPTAAYHAYNKISEHLRPARTSRILRCGPRKRTKKEGLFGPLLALYVLLALLFVSGADMAAAAAGTVKHLALPLEQEFAVLADVDQTLLPPAWNPCFMIQLQL